MLVIWSSTGMGFPQKELLGTTCLTRKKLGMISEISLKSIMKCLWARQIGARFPASLQEAVVQKCSLFVFFLTENSSLLCYVAYSLWCCTHMGFLLMPRHTNRVGLGSSCAFKTLINHLLVHYYKSDHVSAPHRCVHTQMWLVESDSLVEWPSVYFYTLWTLQESLGPARP